MSQSGSEVFRCLSSWHHRGVPCIAAVGTFDGVHQGHRALVTKAASWARSRGLPLAVVTFEPHPREVLHERASLRISSPDEKIDDLIAVGADAVVVLPFDKRLYELSARQFAERILFDTIRAQGVFVGFNFRFGRQADGGVEALIELGRQRDRPVSVLDPVTVEGELVSSSRIRKLLHEGAVKSVRELLGRSYRMSGTVVAGEGRGRKLGFPTANLAADEQRKIVPRFGVYGGSCRIDDNQEQRPCLVAVGVSPTFGQRAEARIEVYVPGIDRDLYGHFLQVSFDEWIRPECRFDSTVDLVQQMKQDLRWISRHPSRFPRVSRRHDSGGEYP